MSYRLSSVLVISPNDTHSYFLYYLYGYGFESQWIDEWVQLAFDRIAAVIGPEGVIVGPSKEHQKEFLTSVYKITRGDIEELFSEYIYPEIVGDALPVELDTNLNDESEQEAWANLYHISAFGHTPLFILSQFPLHMPSESGKASLINLQTCKSEQDVGKVVDILIHVIKNDDWEYLSKLETILNKSKVNEDKLDLLDALELKPNMFGLGINFNLILRKIAEAIIRRSRAEQ